MAEYISVANRQTGETAVQDTARVKVEADPNGNHWQKVLVGLIPPHDYLEIAYPSPTKEIWTYRQGGTYDGSTYTGGSTTGVIHTTYTDATKQYVSHTGRVS